MTHGYEISPKTWIGVGLFVLITSLFFYFAKDNPIFLIFIFIGGLFLIYGFIKQGLKGRSKRHHESLNTEHISKKIHTAQHTPQHNITIKQCISCGNKVYSNYRYCPFCGAKQ